MLVARIVDTFPQKHGTDLSKTFKNRYKDWYQDLARVVIHNQPSDLKPAKTTAGTPWYEVDGTFSITRRDGRIPVVHANPSDHAINALYVVEESRSSTEDLQYHLFPEDNQVLPSQPIFQTASIPLGLVDKKTHHKSELYVNMMFGVLPYGTVIRRINMLDIQGKPEMLYASGTGLNVTY